MASSLPWLASGLLLTESPEPRAGVEAQYTSDKCQPSDMRASLLTKVHIVKGIVFPAVTYGCECWITKKAGCQRIDAFELWYWRRLLRIPWRARRSNQSILKETNPEYSLEGRILKLQSFGHLMWRADSLEKTLMLGKIEGRKRGQQRVRMIGWHHQLNGHEFEQSPGVANGQGSLVCCSPWGHRVRHD